jgi:hypothetical protein
MPATINGTSGFGGNLTGNVTGNADTATSSTTATKLSTTTGDAPVYACRAWVNFDGANGAPVSGEFRCTIRSNGNVSKVVRNATGSYSVFYTTEVPANACAVGSAHETTQTGIANVNQWVSTHAVSTTQCNVFICDVSNVGQNANVVSVAVFA